MEQPSKTGTLTPEGRRRRALWSNGNAIGISLLVFLFLYRSLSDPLARLFLRLNYLLLQGRAFLREEVVEQLCTAFVFLISIGVSMLLYQKLTGIPWKTALPFRRPEGKLVLCEVPFALGMSVLGGLVATGLTLVVMLFGVTPYIGEIVFPKTTAGLILFFLNTALLPAILEEMMFRGLVLQSLRRFGDEFALVVSSALFAMAHGNLLQSPNAFLVGLVLGLFCLRTGSLWGGMLAHFLNNGIILALNLVTMARGEELQGAMLFALHGIYVLFGLIALIVLLRREDQFFLLHRLSPERDFPKKGRTLFFSPGMILWTIGFIVLSLRAMRPI